MYLYNIKHRNQALADKIVNDDSDMSFAGVTAGNNVGEVWADDPGNPSFALVWSEYLGGFSFMGTGIDNINMLSLRAFIDEDIYSFLKCKGINEFEFSCDSERWLPIICDSLSNHTIKCDEQFVYKLDNETTYSTGGSLPAGYKNVEVTSGFLQNATRDFQNYNILQKEITNAWNSTDEFLKYGKGFAVTYKNEICSFALTHFRYKNTYSIGVETFMPHRQKGLSSHLVKLLINRILEQNGNVWWDCMESNVASQKTAQRAGLVFKYKYKVCWFDF